MGLDHGFRPAAASLAVPESGEEVALLDRGKQPIRESGSRTPFIACQIFPTQLPPSSTASFLPPFSTALFCHISLFTLTYRPVPPPSSLQFA